MVDGLAALFYLVGLLFLVLVIATGVRRGLSEAISKNIFDPLIEKLADQLSIRMKR